MPSHFNPIWLKCDPMDDSLPGSSIHGIFQARILEWVAMPFSRGSSWPRDRTRISCLLHWQMGSSSPLPLPGKPIYPVDVHMWKLKIFTKMYIATWGGHGNPLQYPCLKCPHGKRTLAGCSLCCAKNRTQLSNSAQHNTYSNWGLPRGLTGKQSTFQWGTQETWVQFPCWEDPKEEEMQPTPVFSPGKSHGLRSLAGYSP